MTNREFISDLQKIVDDPNTREFDRYTAQRAIDILMVDKENLDKEIELDWIEPNQ